MTTMVLQRDIGSLVTPRIGGAFASATAGGAGNNAQVTGASIDRLIGGTIANSADFTVYWQTTLAVGKTLSLKNCQIEHSADGASWSVYRTFSDPGVVAAGPTGGGTISGQTSFGASLTSAMRYVRLDFTPVLSATATDAAQLLGAAAFAGFDQLPAPV